MEVVETLFASDNSGEQFEVPLTKYQVYCIYRFRLDLEFDLRSDVGRMKALMWYLEGYSALRRPVATPFSGSQIRWMLASAAPYLGDGALPRIVEAFWRRSMMSLDPAIDLPDLAYWWSAELAPHCGIEHFLVPNSFIKALITTPAADTSFGISAFLKLFMTRRPDIGWRVESPTERLASYIRVLCEPLGLHYALFFPPGVLEFIAVLQAPGPRNAAILHLEAADCAYVAERARAALAYAAQHRRLRSGALDISAPGLGVDWLKEQRRPAREDPRRPARALVAASDTSSGTLQRAPLRLIGPLNSQSGLGQATRMSVEALASAGRAPELVDFYLDNPAPRVARYVTGSGCPHTRAINLLHLNAESIPLAPAYLDAELFKGSYNIGYFFWELPRPARCHELALELLDEIWVSSEFNREGYQALTDKPVVKVGMAVETLPEAGDRARVRSQYGLSPNATVFMTTFDSFSFIMRKNPAAVLSAFLLAYGDAPDANVQLVVKTHNMSAILGEPGAGVLIEEIQRLAESDPRIIVIDKTLSFTDLLTLKAACDCYVSLHRSEGWGFGALEAMQLGLPVIATDFSGNLEFCTADTAYLVPYRQRYLEPNDYIFVQPGDYWAEADVGEAALMMRHVHDSPEEAQARGAAARRFVERHFSVAAVGARYDDRLRAIEAAFASADIVQ